ncbi:TerC family protein [Denitrobacterium detoxificans]|uniref:Membrane protein TerC, possibly involved in tellurium resistance n=1 Tax=Denitrobacterium detoxificans TaxID=79604 RepID=A0A1H8RQX2_9ACTN|nr:TerC family protein [Denitrobacterium detoxificans]SEO68578.1 Membrane protein TerC, possibly involved in tellurium resistance [Denitrobacterium detoxificans]
MIDFSIFLTAEAWISLLTLVFLEIVLGVDNIAFIALTTNRLPESKQHIGRKLGLAGAMIMRVIFLCFASWLIHMTQPVFTVDLGFYSHGFSVRDMLLAAGGIYLIYKGASELRSMLALEELRAKHGDDADKKAHQIGLGQAVGTIMVMDIVFSIDSVITAVGMAEHLIIMIIAVISAILLMMVFIDQVSDFINKHAEITILALVFILSIGVLLTLDGFGLHTGVEIEALGMSLEKVLVYFAMIFSLVMEIIQMTYNKRAAAFHREREIERGREEMRQELIEKGEIEA